MNMWWGYVIFFYSFINELKKKSAEAIFTISVTKDYRIRLCSRRPLNNSRTIHSFNPFLAIYFNSKDGQLMGSLQSFFGVGNIKKDLRNNAITSLTFFYIYMIY